MERRGRIPVAKFRTQEGKTRSRSRVREPDYNEQDPETDLFTLLEDNIALKEENKALQLQIEEQKKAHNELSDEKTKIQDELAGLQKQQALFDVQIKDIQAKHTKVSSERNALDKLNKMKVDTIHSLSNELQHLRERQEQKSTVTVVGSEGLKSKLLKILPTLTSTEMESLVEMESSSTMPITSELVERLVDEFLILRNSMNSVELQLYEANEKISELMENQHHMEEDNETLRTENTNLTKVAKLLTENMKESVETSRKMEGALIKLKQRNDELMAKSRDLIDGQPAPSPSPTTIKGNAELEQITEEVHNQNRDHGERIVEMRALMEAALEKSTNDKLRALQLRVEIMEEELRKAVARAEDAESALDAYKTRGGGGSPPPDAAALAPVPPPPPPPIPPPLPAGLLYQAPTATLATAVAGGSHAATFSDSIAAHDFHNKESGGHKIIDNVLHQVQPEAATGLDALVREFKTGRVTLRRNRRKTRTNDALQEMFQVLEISQKQNRDSKICIDLHI